MDEKENQVNVSVNQEEITAQPTVSAPRHACKRRFSGSYDHSIDSKGRMIIPTSFRETLGAGFVCCLALDGKSIALYPSEAWEAEEDRVAKLMETDRTAERLLIRMNKFAYTECEMDAQGRFLLPTKLRQKVLKDVRDINIHGAGAYVRILTQDDSEHEDEEFELDIPNPLAFIAAIQKEQN